jgi:hypothetical protein
VRKALRYFLIGIAVVCGLLVVGVLILHQAAQREPEFYQQALSVDVEHHHEEAGDQLEQSVLDLHNDVREAGTWEAVFTEEQVNGWVASDMPDKFPKVLPPGTQEPRVAINPEAIRVACRFDNGKLRTVISFALDVDLTTETNTLAIRISKLRAGALPVPLKQILDKITAAARRGKLPLRWTQFDGDPVALVTVPVTHEDYAHREIYLDSITLQEGELHLAGHTEQAEARVLRAAALDQPSSKATSQR